MHTIFLLTTAIILAHRHQTISAIPTWPAPTDDLEDILYLTTGYRSRGFAAPVTPCSKGLGANRITGAEWLRTAFHDSISGNIYTGVGGLDGSIAWELSSRDNEGVFASDAVATWAPYVSDLTSLADIIAASTYAAARSCGNISIAVRGGRIDATEAGPSGFVPQPQNTIGTFRNQFARMGLNDQSMVQFVACGHSLGGVHGADHPEITDSALAAFDSTPYTLDNSIAVEYVAGTTKDSLVVGKSVAAKRNSDFVVFSQTDRNASIKALAADPNFFAGACKTLFQTMIDLVPSGTQLSDPVTPYDVKPYELQLTLLPDGAELRFTGEIRVRTTQRAVSHVALSYTDRNGAAAPLGISTTPAGTAAGFDDTFSFFAFSAAIPVNTSISSFTVAVTYTDAPTSTQTYTNNDTGFQVQDTLLYQAPQSCFGPSSGNLTVVAAARNASATPTLQVLLKVPQESPNPVPSISTTAVPMARQSAVGAYQLWAGGFTFSGSEAEDAVFGVVSDDVEDGRKSVAGLGTGCAALDAGLGEG